MTKHANAFWATALFALGTSIIVGIGFGLMIAAAMLFFLTYDMVTNINQWSKVGLTDCYQEILLTREFYENTIGVWFPSMIADMLGQGGISAMLSNN